MAHADKGKQVSPLFWVWTGRTLEIHQRGLDWDANDEADVSHALRMISGDVPLEGWRLLAAEFLADFDRTFS